MTYILGLALAEAAGALWLPGTFAGVGAVAPTNAAGPASAPTPAKGVTVLSSWCLRSESPTSSNGCPRGDAPASSLDRPHCAEWFREPYCGSGQVPRNRERDIPGRAE
jgi:hypothetical protein